jgi:hypothetical protein
VLLFLLQVVALAVEPLLLGFLIDQFELLELVLLVGVALNVALELAGFGLLVFLVCICGLDELELRLLYFLIFGF